MLTLAFSLGSGDQKCIGAPAFRALPGIDNWCEINCLRYPPNCPETACHCPQECVAIGELEGREGADTYCMDECLNYRSDCPRDRCRCY
ncbi:GH24607 [Drosophila grimshawi]|uniref:GH24607 n=1 Tax=Drosophila grimshawi TaxID=7222 RepID=B4JMA2_DROGR|nr:GH24607 [Drosophila grimshawi]